MTVFPFAAYWWLYLAFTGLIIGLLWMDLAFHSSRRALTLRNASAWTAVWILLALGFCAILYLFVSAKYSPALGRQLGMEFIAGYVVEESLSIDNMFVFALIFRHFGLPMEYQHRVLFYGVLGAIVFRGIFIAVGVVLVRFEWVLVAFGVLLILSAVRLLFERETRFDPGSSRLMRLVCRVFPATPQLHGSSFLTRIDGRLHATPLLVLLLFLESTDLLFATDSVPAVLGVTREPFIVFSSNIFAVLGLRAMFFLLAGALDRFYALKYGLAIVLAFVGVKMIWLDHLSGGRFPIHISLGIIGGLIAVCIAISLVFPKRDAAQLVKPANLRLPAPGLIVGAVFLLLAAVATWCAVSPVQTAAILPALAQTEAGYLCISAVCYAIGGALLLRGSLRPRDR